MSITFETTKACACGEAESALTKLWIWCEGCKSWYHSSCVLMEDAEVEDINKKNQDWYCGFVRCQAAAEFWNVTVLLNSDFSPKFVLAALFIMPNGPTLRNRSATISYKESTTYQKKPIINILANKAKASETKPTKKQQRSPTNNTDKELTSRNVASHDSRLSAIEAANKGLTLEIKKLQELSTKLEEELERVQFVLTQVIDLESKVESLGHHYKQVTGENAGLKTEVSQLKSEIEILRDQLQRFEEAQVQTEKGISVGQQEMNSNIIIRGVDLEENVSK
ncbi:hypothetical protein Bhyg_07652, partial [Pseudolycoriella hygida]